MTFDVCRAVNQFPFYKMALQIQSHRHKLKELIQFVNISVYRFSTISAAILWKENKGGSSERSSDPQS